MGLGLGWGRVGLGVGRVGLGRVGSGWGRSPPVPPARVPPSAPREGGVSPLEGGVSTARVPTTPLFGEGGAAPPSLGSAPEAAHASEDRSRLLKGGGG